MNTFYLKDGRLAELITKTDKGYLIDPYVTFRTYEDETDSAPSGDYEFVDQIFNEAPKELIEAECQKIYDRMNIISTERDKILEEKNILSREVESLKREKTNLTRLIFNRSDIKNAKRFVVFPSNQIAPVIYDQQNRHKLSLSIEITDYDPKIRAWVYKFCGDDRYASGDYFDEEYGVKCDLTDDEIMALNMQRVSAKKFDDWVVKRTDDKWLTPELIERKNIILNNEKIAERSAKEKQLAEIQKWLEFNRPIVEKV